MHGTYGTAARRPGPGGGEDRDGDGDGVEGGAPRAAVALDLPDTAEALTRYRARSGTWTRGGLALLAGVVVVALAAQGRGMTWPQEVLPSVCGLALFATGLGVGARRLARRMGHRLAGAPWTACAAVSVPRGLHAGTVVLRDPVTGDLWPMAVVAVQQRYQLVEPGPGGVLWWCGDPRTGGVIAPPGGAELVWTRAVRGERARLRNVRAAAEHGLLDRPVPRQPQPAPRRYGRYGSGAAAPSGAAGAAAPSAATPARPAPPVPPESSPADSAFLALTAAVRHRGVFRWVLLVGVIALGVGIASFEASMKDPQIELTVIDERSDGVCAVRWTEPWSGAERRGTYHCDPDRDPLLDDWETGWLVSYGPWKGELYDAEERGTIANDVNGAVFLAGAALTLTGLAGGGLRLWRWRRSQEGSGGTTVGSGGIVGGAGAGMAGGGRAPLPSSLPSPSAPALRPRPPVSLAKVTDHLARADRRAAVAFTYAALAAEARSAPLPRPGGRYRPDLDIRAVRWWRVRTLRELSSLTAVLQSLGVAAGVGVLWLIPGDEMPWLTLLVGGFCAAAGVTALGRLVWRGVPTVHTLVRAALAPVPVPKRYVLLNDPYGAGPVLLFFPAHGGDDDLPEALLGVLPPGTARRPWLGLPAPTGEAELRGWLDPSPAVVPWIEGRALWPRHPYEEINPNDPGIRTYLELLAPNVTAADDRP
ncbi:hypothetical protein ACFXKG_09055 [Streptomyces sp. NPDC059255]|uniref:hypothetical protein n=1 Tax=Streptomyces sp. NPDC059255 TaxID=3346793 RepID=UPI0036C4136D